MKEKILEIVFEALDNLNKNREEKIDLSNLEDVVLYGTNGVFNSLDLVNFLSAVETEIEDQFDQVLTLASEKAVSRKISPFGSVARLVEFILDEMSEITQESNHEVVNHVAVL